MRLSKFWLAGGALFLITGVAMGPAFLAHARVEDGAAGKSEAGEQPVDGLIKPLFTPTSPHAGAYLAARFAQSRHDWASANGFLDQLVSSGVSESSVLRRAMILSMGGGQPERAIQLAQRIVKIDPESRNSVAQVFLIIDAVAKGQYERGVELILKTPHDEMTEFIGPVLESWTKAGMGQMDIARLQDNPLQLYHAILITQYLKNSDEMKKLLDRFSSSEGIAVGDYERVGDLYAYLGDTEKALELYKSVVKEWPGDRDIAEKIQKVKDGKGSDIFKGVKDPREGLALAFFDISKVLYQENNDESARVLASMSLYLNPDLTEVRFLLGYVATRHERHEEAIAHFKVVEKGDRFYLDAQRNIADSYESLERYSEALGILEILSKNENDLDAQIKIGDIYRRQDQFGKAIQAYSQAEKMLGGVVPEKYWHLLYLRGMSYERDNNWEAAERDLSAALKFKPDHPYILNYLGYAWADRSKNLGEALAMIRKASALRPEDGYITDSLGWVLYRLGKFKEAVPELERAVSLLPYDPVINDHLGDAYWRVGRVMEAKFQWTRAKNHSDDEELKAKIVEKLDSGLPPDTGYASLGEESQKGGGTPSGSTNKE